MVTVLLEYIGLTVLLEYIGLWNFHLWSQVQQSYQKNLY